MSYLKEVDIDACVERHDERGPIIRPDCHIGNLAEDIKKFEAVFPSRYKVSTYSKIFRSLNNFARKKATVGELDKRGNRITAAVLREHKANLERDINEKFEQLHPGGWNPFRRREPNPLSALTIDELKCLLFYTE